MKNSWTKRLADLEKPARFAHASEELDLWVRTHLKTVDCDYWELWTREPSVLPPDLRLECMLRALKQKRAAARPDVS